jgi:SAM-dependent methyltransferase
VANLVASTTGTDADWVVKVIDVYPDEVAEDAQLGGYQLMVSADIFRGRYRESLETPKAVKAGEALAYRFPLPAVHHVFLPGHRVMVQVQSSWFPLYDRNPQTFVPSIFNARPGDYRAATQRVHHAPGKASFIELPVVGPAAAPPGAVGPGSPAEAAMFAKNAEYEHFMGRWSRLLSPKHLAFAGVKDGDRVLDVGAGTGALASQVAAAMPSSEVVGIDPSPAFVEYAQRKAASKREHFEVGDAQALRFKTGEFDATLAQLVMNFIPDHQKAVREMRRVTRPGGVISACVWGYDDGTDMLRYFWDEVVADDPRMAARGERTIKLARKGELAAVWRGAGLLDVKEAAVGVPLSFSSFEDYWQPFLDGVGPAGAWVASLDEPGRKKVETRLRKSLLGERADGPIVLQARAWCVRGQVPAGP